LSGTLIDGYNVVKWVDLCTVTGETKSDLHVRWGVKRTKDDWRTDRPGRILSWRLKKKRPNISYVLRYITDVIQSGFVLRLP
jgi:hypothetical protein